MTNMEWIITAEQVGQRLDVLMTQLLETITRAQVKKMIDGEHIKVNGKAAKGGAILRLNDVVTYVVPETVIRPVREVRDPLVIVETDDYIAIDKPSGLTVHGGDQVKGKTLTDWLAVHYPMCMKVGDDPIRPGIIHRLDKEASGVMLIAKTQEGFEGLKRQFKLREVKKEYLILVEGFMPRLEGEINFKLSRSRTHRTRIAASRHEGRDALTKFVVEQNMPKAALVRVTPETGRTHQIRVHFFAFGHPVAGDPLYQAKKPLLTSPRLMLHAVKLSFFDLAGVWQEIECLPDSDFMGIVDNSLALR